MAYAKYCSDRSIAYVKYDGKSGTNKQDFRDPDATLSSITLVSLSALTHKRVSGRAEGVYGPPTSTLSLYTSTVALYAIGLEDHLVPISPFRALPHGSIPPVANGAVLPSPRND